VGLLKPRGSFKQKTLLQNAQEIVNQRLEENYASDLSRVGVMWAGILELETPIPASEVAAMLSCFDLIRATTLVDSEPHWTNAAVFAAIAHSSDVEAAVAVEEVQHEPAARDFDIGFSKPKPQENTED
jgi:hypothetical protein